MKRLISCNRINRNLFNYKNVKCMSTKISIQVKQGTIIGEEDLLPNGESYYSFKGIPYAVPPLGKLRFEAPQPLDKFTENPLDCTKERDVSFCRDPFTKTLVGSENSLHLNIYTPKIKSSNKCLPVMVWIHPGAFAMGSGNSDFYHPLYLIQEDVIVVTFNYRLGLFGFLSLPDANVPGNAGLKDQLQVLKWVKENIEQFNGDINNITLFGHSAGAGSVHLHVISENSNKYFHKAILKSGTANMEWVLQRNSTDKTRKLAELLGFKGTTDHELIEFLKNIKDPADLWQHILAVLTPDERRRGLPLSFRPCLEDKSIKDAVLTQSPIDVLRTTNVTKMPVMMGYTSAEGLGLLTNALTKLADIEKDLGRFIPRSVNLEIDDPNFIELINKVRQFYLNGGPVDKKSLNNLSDLIGDCNFIIGCHAAAELYAKYQHEAPCYFFRFNYVGERNMFKKWYQLEKLKGACHGDEMFYLFQMAEGELLEAGSRDEKVMLEMCKMWTNFAKYNNPTPADNNNTLPFQWNPVKKVPNNSNEFTLDYLEIDENTRMEQNPDIERIDFWREVYRKSNKDFLMPVL